MYSYVLMLAILMIGGMVIFIILRLDGSFKELEISLIPPRIKIKEGKWRDKEKKGKEDDKSKLSDLRQGEAYEEELENIIENRQS
ncbi:MAG: hypothetical protein ACFFBS_08660 [Promethearchaeota archaeon]